MKVLLTPVVDASEVRVAGDCMREIGRSEGAKYILGRANAEIGIGREGPDDTAEERCRGVLQTKIGSEKSTLETRPDTCIGFDVERSNNSAFLLADLKLDVEGQSDVGCEPEPYREMSVDWVNLERET